MQIDRFRLADMDRILEIEAAAFPGEAYTRRMFAELHRDCGGFFFVARRRRKTAGYMVTCARILKAEIVSIAVDPDFRRLGVGGALVAHTIERLKESRVRTLELMVRTTNRGGIRFYRGLGFKAAGRVADYYEDGAAAMRMRMRI